MIVIGDNGFSQSPYEMEFVSDIIDYHINLGYGEANEKILGFL